MVLIVARLHSGTILVFDPGHEALGIDLLRSNSKVRGGATSVIYPSGNP